MPHPRQAIRDAVAAALIAGATAAGSRVTKSRMVPTRPGDLPALGIYDDDEDGEDQGTAPRTLYRTLQFQIAAWVAASESLEDDFDDLALQVERVMHADPTFGDVCSGSVYKSTQKDIQSNGNRPMGVMLITYSVIYETHAPEAADMPREDLETVATQYDLAGAQAPADQLSDLIENLED